VQADLARLIVVVSRPISRAADAGVVARLVSEKTNPICKKRKMTLRVLEFIFLVVLISSCTPMIHVATTPETASSQMARVTLTSIKMPLQATHILVIAPSPAVTATLGTPTTMLRESSAATSAQGFCSPFRRQLNLPGCILSFTAVPTEVVAGGSITFTWAVTGTTKVGLALHHFEGIASGRGFRSWDNLPATGSLTIQLNDLATGVYPFRVWADDPEAGAGEYIEVYYACYDPFFPKQWTPSELCQGGPAVSTAATQQVFEHGLMVWLESEKAVYILFQRDSGVIPQEWTIPNIESNGEPEDGVDVTPPSGKYQPINGLGKIWQSHSLLKSLGWALAPEQHFTSTVQRGFGIRLPLYFRLADDRVVYIVDSQDFSRMTVPFWGYLSP
jgi:hypothetical protein